jgi:hypothetical protein
MTSPPGARRAVAPRSAAMIAPTSGTSTPKNVVRVARDGTVIWAENSSNGSNDGVE